MADEYLHSLTDIWNSGSTTYYAIKMNVTDTASASDSKLVEQQVGGVAKWSVDKAGNLVLAGGASAASLTLTTELAVAHGGTGASTPGDARNNLGLGTIATQNASSVTLSTATASPLTIGRVSSSLTTAITYTNTGGSIYAGLISGLFNVGNDINLAANPWLSLGSSTLKFGILGAGIVQSGASGDITSSYDMPVPIRAPNGTVSLPSYTFTQDTDTGVYLVSAGIMAGVIGGVEGWRIDATYFRSTKVYDATIGSAANIFIDSFGRMFRSTSALKYKLDLKPVTQDQIDAWLGLEGFTYRPADDKSNDNAQRRFGFAADHARDKGLHELVNYGADGEVEGYEYGRDMAIAHTIIKRLLSRIETLEAKIGSIA